MGESHQLNHSCPQVALIMGSLSDRPLLQGAVETLQKFHLSFEVKVVSAHRTPLGMVDYAQSAQKRGIKVIIAAAGGAAHLPGMVASLTTLPVIGVPLKSPNSLDGWDSILSILQMPAGVPVATMALGGAQNAAILAAQILGLADPLLQDRLRHHQEELILHVQKQNQQLAEK
jgi:5-(carboxyamino)imidazole ribonucleotide mutase